MNSTAERSQESVTESENPTEALEAGRRDLLRAMGAGVAGASLLGSALDETGKASAAAPAGTVGMNLGPPRGRQLAFVDAAITLQDYRQVGESELTFDDRGYPNHSGTGRLSKKTTCASELG